MGVLEGKVALISGAARGQGRSHAVRLAEEGASIIGFDLCRTLDSVDYPMSTPEDLAETVKLVEQAGGKMLAIEADVRDRPALAQVVDQGVAEFGGLDIVLANAGIMAVTRPQQQDYQGWVDSIDIMLSGVYNTIEAALPSLRERGTGGSIVITGSTAGLIAMLRNPDTVSPGFAGYIAAKHGVVGLMKMYALSQATFNIRVNAVHPTGVNTPMVVNDAFPPFIAGDPILSADAQNRLDVRLIEPVDVSNAIVWLCSDHARYVTGINLPVDAGRTL